MRVTVVMAALLLSAAPARAADSPAAAVREFFAAYAAGENLDGWWTGKSASREAFEHGARAVHRTRCLTIEGLRIDGIAIDDDAAAARITLLLVRRERATGRVWGPDPVNYDVKLSRGGEA